MYFCLIMLEQLNKYLGLFNWLDCDYIILLLLFNGSREMEDGQAIAFTISFLGGFGHTLCIEPLVTFSIYYYEAVLSQTFVVFKLTKQV